MNLNNKIFNLRDKNEFVKYFKKNGINLSEDEIDQIKESYTNPDFKSNFLNKEQLDKVAGGGGSGKSGTAGHRNIAILYRRRKSEGALPDLKKPGYDTLLTDSHTLTSPVGENSEILVSSTLSKDPHSKSNPIQIIIEQPDGSVVQQNLSPRELNKAKVGELGAIKAALDRDYHFADPNLIQDYNPSMEIVKNASKKALAKAVNAACTQFSQEFTPQTVDEKNLSFADQEFMRMASDFGKIVVHFGNTVAQISPYLAKQIGVAEIANRTAKSQGLSMMDPEYYSRLNAMTSDELKPILQAQENEVLKGSQITSPNLPPNVVQEVSKTVTGRKLIGSMSDDAAASFMQLIALKLQRSVADDIGIS